jgi:uncharacterized membrane protein YfhO
MAYRTFLLTEKIERMDIAAMGIAAVPFLAMAFFGPQEMSYVIASAGLCVLYLLLLDYSRDIKLNNLRRIISAAFLLLMLTELTISAFIGVRANSTTIRDAYPDKYAQVQKLLDMRQNAESEFYRTEFTFWFTLNDSSLYNYNGISLFSSTASSSVSEFMIGLGLPGWGLGNRYYYIETTPLANAFLNMRYLISRSGGRTDTGVYWKSVGREDDSLLLENIRYLPLGFMVNEDLSEYEHYDNNPFLSQNNLFRRATGLDGSLFMVRDLGNHSYAWKDDEVDVLRWDYEVPANGMVYAYYNIENIDVVNVSFNEVPSLRVEIKRPLALTIGHFSKGDVISFMVDQSKVTNNILLHVGYFNSELFDQGYALLSANSLNLTKFSGTKITGSVTAAKDGLLYTSIPGKHNWSAFVDGIEAEIILIDGCMTALRLNEGKHDIEFRYHNKSLTTGIIISLVSLAVFLMMILVQLRKQRSSTSSP